MQYEHQLSEIRLSRSLPVFIPLILLVTTFILWKQASLTAFQANKDYFDFRVREAIERIENRMGTYQQVLHGARGLYEASEAVTRHEFRRFAFAQHLAENFPGIQGLGFSLIIPNDQIESHLSAVRNEGYPEYNIRPEGDRDQITSIVYLEPLADRNLRAFGYDMFSEPVRREAMERSRDTDKPAMSGKVRLVQEYGKKEQAGFLIYLPIYKNGSPHDTLSNRQANIIGWVYSPFRMDDLMEGIFGEHADDLDVEIFDGEKISSESLMYDSNKNLTVSLQKHNKSKNTLNSIQTRIIAGHVWTISIYAWPSLYERIKNNDEFTILIVGIIGSILSGWLSWLLIMGRERALKIAREMNTQYIESETKLQAILDSSAIAIAWTNESGEMEYVNPTFISMFGYTIKDIPNIAQWYIRAYPDKDYREKIIAEWESNINHAKTHSSNFHMAPMETEIVCNDGSKKQVMILGSLAGSRIIANFTDITEQKRAEDLNKHLATYDSLTDLPNRMLFNERLKHTVNLAKRDKSLFAVLFIDLDKFKSINDQLGHDIGDTLLKESAARMVGCLRESDTVARTGGDEFIILLPNIQNEANITLVADKICFVMNHPFFIEGHSINISASIGVAIFPENGDCEIILIKHADIAMYKAKKNGGNTAVFFKPEMLTDN